MTMIEVTPSGQACGATVRGVDLSQPVSDEAVAEIREIWLTHHVLSFPDQAMTDDDLEAFTLAMGGFGDDPYIAPIPGREHIVAIERRADETASLFAESFHSDWSFQAVPPAGTCLYGITIPPTGGDTLFANQHLALEQMPDDLRNRIDGLTAIHSARLPYAPQGSFGEGDGADRSMTIITSPAAEATQTHPLVRRHPETGRNGVFSTLGYIIGIEGMDDGEATELLVELYRWQTREEFIYRHRWTRGNLVMWDNRSVLHAATGGYDGHDRLLHRTTIRGLSG